MVAASHRAMPSSVAKAGCDPGELASDIASGGHRYIEVPNTACIAAIDALSWASTVALRSADQVIGVRVNDPATGDAVRALSPAHVLEHARADRNLSLRIAPSAPGDVTDGQDLHLLYRTFVPIMRSRSIERTLRALWHELDARAFEPRHGKVVVDAAVVIHDGAAHLFGSDAHRTLVVDLRRLEGAGLHLLERSQVELDLADGAIVVPEPPALQHVSARLRDRLGAYDMPPPPAVYGTIPVASWTPGPDAQGAAARVAGAAAQVVHGVAALDARTLLGLSRLVSAVGDLAPAWSRTTRLADAVRVELSAR